MLLDDATEQPARLGGRCVLHPQPERRCELEELSAALGVALLGPEPRLGIIVAVRPQPENPTRIGGPEPARVLLGHERLPDLVYAGTALRLELSRPERSFSSASWETPGELGVGVVIGDLDVDGALDAVGWTELDGVDAFLVLLGDGSGGLRESSLYPAEDPRGITAIGDLTTPSTSSSGTARSSG